MNWVLIAAAVILVLIILKFKEIRHKFGFLIILFILLFLGLSFWNVYQANNLDLKTFDGFVTSGKVYFSWLGSLLSNTKALTTYAVKQDWKINDYGLDKINASGSSQDASITKIEQNQTSQTVTQSKGFTTSSVSEQ